MPSISITKASFINLLAERTNTPKLKVDVLLSTMNDIIVECLARDHVFTLPGLVQFSSHPGGRVSSKIVGLLKQSKGSKGSLDLPLDETPNQDDDDD